MSQNSKRVVAELSKVWDQVVSKGKLQGQNVLKSVTAHLAEGSTRMVLPRASVTHQELADRARDKVQSGMTAYEDFIGIKQVKEAHARVLQAETKFVGSQEERRQAQRELSEVQNQLRLLRVEIDRTARGDDRYLELIKREIDVVREERSLRSRFEDLEKRERELFSELSNALRFSHEKERAQNEKTKYWSVLGSIVGAFLGIVGTTVNSRLKQNQTKIILSQTSSQVDQIEQTVQALALKLDNNLRLDEENSKYLISGKLEEVIAQLDHTCQTHQNQLQTKADTLVNATKAVESKLNKMLVTLAYYEENGIDPGVKIPPLENIDELQKNLDKYRPREKEFWLSAIGVVILGALAYKLY